MTVELDEESYTYLLQVLNEKYYSTTEIKEMRKINALYKVLKFKSENWLSNLSDNQ